MRFDVLAGTTPRYTATIVDEDNVAIPLASLTTLTLTVVNTRTGAAVNGRDRQNVLNANNVTVHATSGLVTWSIQALDLPSTVDETYICAFEWSWSAGAKKGWHDLSLVVTPVPRPV